MRGSADGDLAIRGSSVASGISMCWEVAVPLTRRRGIQGGIPNGPRSRRSHAAVQLGVAALCLSLVCGAQTFDATAGVSELTIIPPGATPPSIFNSVRPSISGRPIVGHLLSTTRGAWSGTPPLSYEFQWQRCTKACVDIPGETEQNYLLISSDVDARLRAIVKVTGPQGGASAMSDTTPRVQPSPAIIRAALRGISPPHGHRVRLATLEGSRGPLVRFDAPGPGYLGIFLALRRPLPRNRCMARPRRAQARSDDRAPSTGPRGKGPIARAPFSEALREGVVRSA
jgi:hypothetical protein